MNIAVIGFDRQGRSAYEYWNKPGNSITICDKDDTLSIPEGLKAHLGSDYLKGIDSFDLIIRTPGLHPRVLQEAGGPDIFNKVSTVTDEFIKVCPSRNIIGVTGTKGKGTTSTLIAKMLESGGFRTHLGGNIGIAPLELLKNDIKPDDWVVLELANFQLIDLKHSPHIGVCLMVEPEHLDWHTDTEEYYQAKSQLFINQKPDDVAIYYSANEVSKRIASSGEAKTIPYFSNPGAYVEKGKITIDNISICNTDELALLGEHNWQNACAALTCFWQISQDKQAAKDVLTTFSGLPYRIQLLRTKDNVRFYNDSFSSQPAATIAALKSVKGMKILIVGGKDRGLDLNNLANAIRNEADNIRHVLLIGESADRVADNLNSIGFSNYSISKNRDMTSIVSEAVSYSSKGDAIILTPGFPSFDMFKNFEQRGELFTEAVAAL